MNTNGFHISQTASILVIAGILVAGAVAYMMMSNSTPPAGTVSITGGPATESEATFVTLAGQLDSIVFNTAILSDARFLSLQDIHTAVLPEAVGRPDPFAPLGKR